MTLADVLEAHDRALQFGGLPGTRDLTLIESAIGRPYTGYYRTFARKAAALTFSLAKNHGFADGNKRTALYILNLFLERSGYELTAPTSQTLNIEAEAMILDVVEGRMRFQDLVVWIDLRTRRLTNT